MDTNGAGAQSARKPEEAASPLPLLRARPDWASAVSALKRTASQHDKETDLRARGYAAALRGKPAAMVVDVVLSNQRDYDAFVWPEVQAWMARNPGTDLQHLAAQGPGSVRRLRKDKRADEARTMQEVASGLLDYSRALGVDEKQGLCAWAVAAEPFRFAVRSELYVGTVRGIGIALFAYLRMLGGADAIKPDTRVIKALRRAGLSVARDAGAALLLGEGMAEELGVGRLWFDQLLWYT
ncbi:MAG: hypothetical protein WAV54_07930 [Acidimicrobiales bacterium]|jgi:hypothetical protein